MNSRLSVDPCQSRKELCVTIISYMVRSFEEDTALTSATYFLKLMSLSNLTTTSMPDHSYQNAQFCPDFEDIH
jgi:hypothetical protein